MMNLIYYFMAGKSKIVVKEHLSLREILREIKKRKIDYDLTERLIFISDLFKCISVPKASKNIGVSHSTGYMWLKNGMKRV